MAKAELMMWCHIINFRKCSIEAIAQIYKLSLFTKRNEKSGDFILCVSINTVKNEALIP